MMKNLLIGAALWGFFFAPFAQAQQVNKMVSGTFGGIVQGGSHIGQWFDISPALPNRIYAQYDPAVSARDSLYLQTSLMFEFKKWDGAKRYPCELSLQGLLSCTSPTGYVFEQQLLLENVNVMVPGEETQTCRFYAGDKFFNKNQKDVCAETGGTTGGPNSQPLLCMSKWLGGIQSESQHEYTDKQCTAADPDPAPDPKPPTPDPTPDPNPKPPTPPAGGGSPTSGTTGSTTGTSGGSTVNLVQDFKPITERLDLLRVDEKQNTAYLGQVIAAGDAAGVAATNSLKPLLDAIGVKTDGVGAAVKQAAADIKGGLNDVNNTGKAIEGSIKDGNKALGDKLDGIKQGLDKLNEGQPIDGTNAANSIALPDYDAAVVDGVAKIQNQIDSYATQSGINDLTNEAKLRGMFSGAESLSEVFDLARSGCQPLAFGSHGKFDVCPYTPNISRILEVIIWALTALFIFHFVGSILVRERLS